MRRTILFVLIAFLLIMSYQQPLHGDNTATPIDPHDYKTITDQNVANLDITENNFKPLNVVREPNEPIVAEATTSTMDKTQLEDNLIASVDPFVNRIYRYGVTISSWYSYDSLGYLNFNGQPFVQTQWNGQIGAPSTGWYEDVHGDYLFNFISISDGFPYTIDYFIYIMTFGPCELIVYFNDTYLTTAYPTVDDIYAALRENNNPNFVNVNKVYIHESDFKYDSGNNVYYALVTGTISIEYGLTIGMTFIGSQYQSFYFAVGLTRGDKPTIGKQLIKSSNGRIIGLQYSINSNPIYILSGDGYIFNGFYNKFGLNYQDTIMQYVLTGPSISSISIINGSAVQYVANSSPSSNFVRNSDGTETLILRDYQYVKFNVFFENKTSISSGDSTYVMMNQARIYRRSQDMGIVTVSSPGSNIAYSFNDSVYFIYDLGSGSITLEPRATKLYLITYGPTYVNEYIFDLKVNNLTLININYPSITNASFTITINMQTEIPAKLGIYESGGVYSQEVNISTLGTVTKNFSISVYSLSKQGNVLFNITSIDATGRATTEFINVYVDYTPPTISFEDTNGLTISNGIFFSTSSPAIYVKVTDNLNDYLLDLTVYLDGLKVYDSTIASGNKYNPINQNLADGKHTIEAIAVDRAGNTIRSTLEFYIDTVNPHLSINDLSQNYTDNPYINVTAGDEYLDKIVIYYSFDASTWTTYSTYISNMTNAVITFTSILPANYQGNLYIKITVSDKANHAEEKIILIMVDTYLPTPTVNLNSGQFISGDYTISVDWSGELYPYEISLYINNTLEKNATESTSLSYTLPTASYADGPYEISILYTDKAGHTAWYNVTVNIDNNAPIVLVIDPLNSTFVNSSSSSIHTEGNAVYVYYQFRASDRYLDISKSIITLYRWNGLAWEQVTTYYGSQWILISGDRYMVKIDVTNYNEETFKVVITARDALYTTTESYTFTYDSKAPRTTVNIIQSNGTASYNDASYIRGTVNITVNATDRYFANITIRIESPALTRSIVETYTDPNAVYQYDTHNITDGYTMTVIVTALDKAGNRYTWSKTYTVDNAYPTINPPDQKLIGGNRENTGTVYYGGAYPNIIINTSVEDKAGDLKTVVIYLGPDQVITFTYSGTTWTATVSFKYSGYVSYTIAPGSDGYWLNATVTISTQAVADDSYTVTIHAEDDSGLASDYPFPETVIVDNTAPAISFTANPETGAQGTFGNSSYITGTWNLTASSSDSNPENVTIYLAVNGSAYTTANRGTDSTQYILTTEGDTIYDIKVVAYDKSGNMAVYYVRVFSDNTAPKASINAPLDGSYFNSDFLINVTFSDRWSVTWRVTVKGVDVVYSEDVTPYMVDMGSYYAYTFQVSTLSDDGVYEVILEVSGPITSTTVTVTFTVDRQAPAVNTFAPANESFVSGTVQVRVNSTDRNMDRAQLYVNGTLVASSSTGNLTYSLDTSGDSVYVLKVVVRDKAGNTAVSIHYIYSDNLAPKITLIAPANSSYERGTVTFRVKVEDRWLSAVNIKVDGYSVQPVYTDGTYYWITINTLDWGDGIHEVTVEATDALNTATLRAVYTFDNTPPALGDISIVNRSYYSGSVRVNGTISDANPGRVEIYVNGTLEYNSTEFSYVLSTSGDTVYVIKLKLFDKAGNTAEYTYVIYSDNEAPQISSITVDNTNGYLVSEENITFTVTDRWGYNVTVLTLDSNGHVIDVLYNETSGYRSTALVKIVINGNSYTLIVNSNQYNDKRITFKVVVKGPIKEAYTWSNYYNVDNTPPRIINVTVRLVSGGEKFNGFENYSVIGNQWYVTIYAWDNYWIQVNQMDIYDYFTGKYLGSLGSPANNSFVFDTTINDYSDRALRLVIHVEDGAGHVAEIVYIVATQNRGTDIALFANGTVVGGVFVGPAGNTEHYYETIYMNSFVNVSVNVSYVPTFYRNITVFLDGRMIYTVAFNDTVWGAYLPYYYLWFPVNESTWGYGTHTIEVWVTRASGKILKGIFTVHYTPRVKINSVEVINAYMLNITVRVNATDLAGRPASGNITFLNTNTSEEYTVALNQGTAVISFTVDSPGLYVFNVSFTGDGLPAWVVKSINTVDPLPPSVTIISASPGQPNYNESVVITISATDAETGVSNVTVSYTVDGGRTWFNVSAAYNATGGFYTVTIPAMRYGTTVYYKVIAVDGVGNVEVSRLYSFTFTDSYKPGLSVSGNSTVYAGETIFIYANATEPENASGVSSVVAYIYISWDNETWITYDTVQLLLDNDTGLYGFNYTYGAGGTYFKVIIKAFDRAGNHDSAVLYVAVERRPTVISAPVNVTVHYTDEVNATIRLMDSTTGNGIGNATVHVYVIRSGLTESYTFTVNSTGYLELTFRGNSVGNATVQIVYYETSMYSRAEANITLIVLPEKVNMKVSVDEIQSEYTLRAEGSATDDEGNPIIIGTVTIKLGNYTLATVTLSGGEFTVNREILQLENGNYTLTFVLTADGYETVTVNATLRVAVTVITPVSAPTVKQGTAANITVNITDPDGVRNITVQLYDPRLQYIGDLPYTYENGTLTVTFRPGLDWEAGEYTVLVKTVDGENNTASAMVKVRVEETPMIIEILEPANGSTVQPGAVTFRVKVWYDGLNVEEKNASVAVIIGASYVNLEYVNGSYVGSVQLTAPGTYEATVTAQAGAKKASATVTVTVAEENSGGNSGDNSSGTSNSTVGENSDSNTSSGGFMGVGLATVGMGVLLTSVMAVIGTVLLRRRHITASAPVGIGNSDSEEI